jgi:hypothetical protein
MNLPAINGLHGMGIDIPTTSFCREAKAAAVGSPI